MDTAFAKIVTDLNGRDHILIEGRVISLMGDVLEQNNLMVEQIVRGLRSAVREDVIRTGGTVAAA